MIFALASILVCGDCHKTLVEAFVRSPMARSSGVVRAAEEVAGTVGRDYRITPRMELLVRGGAAVDLAFFIGSRRMGRSFAYSENGHLYQVPVGYYANRKAWDLAPGYERDAHPDLSRPITAECLFCHATRAVPEPQTINRFAAIETGIGCARCHGDPASHAGLVNPSKLAARLRDSVCEQCHLGGVARIERAGRRMVNYRPGEDCPSLPRCSSRPRAPGCG